MDALELRSVLFREQFRGYEPTEVDDALDRLAACLDRAGHISRADLEGLQFRRARFRGYHRGDVDAFVASLRAEAR